MLCWFFVCISIKNSFVVNFKHLPLSSQSRVKWRHKIGLIAKNPDRFRFFFISIQRTPNWCPERYAKFHVDTMKSSSHQSAGPEKRIAGSEKARFPGQSAGGGLNRGLPTSCRPARGRPTYRPAGVFWAEKSWIKFYRNPSGSIRNISFNTTFLFGYFSPRGHEKPPLPPPPPVPASLSRNSLLETKIIVKF